MRKDGFCQQLGKNWFKLLISVRQADFTSAYELHADNVYSLCLYLVCDEEVANDITQRIFDYLLKSSKHLARKDELGSYLEVLTISACMEYFRQVQEVQRAQGEYINPYDNKQTRELLSKLPDSQRAMIYLHATQNMKNRSIAKSLKLENVCSPIISNRLLNSIKRWWQNAR